MHECVVSAEVTPPRRGPGRLDVAKRLMELGFHPPTVYFPLIVEEALMVEPTETESPQTLARPSPMPSSRSPANRARPATPMTPGRPRARPRSVRVDDAWAARKLVVTFDQRHSD